MKKKGRLFSIRSKLIIMLIAVGYIPAAILGTSTYITSLKVVSNKLEVTSSQTTHEISRGIDNYFSAMKNIIKILNSDTNIIEADNPTYFEFAKTLIANTKATDDNIMNIYVGTEKGLFYTEPYAKLPSDFNHKKRDWYIDAMANVGEVVITNPYIDTATGKTTISLVSAIEKGSKTIGVVGMDIDLTAFSEGLSEIKIGDEGYVYITDNQGNLIAHPDHTLIGTDLISTLSIWKEIANSSDGFTEYNYQNEDKFSSFVTSSVTGWKIISSMNYSELSDDMSTILLNMTIAMLLATIAAILFAILFSNPIAKNIKKLLAGFSLMAKGDLSASVSIQSRDEFHLLGNHFNEMTQSISQLLMNVSHASASVLDTSADLANMSEETNASLGEVARAVEELAHGATEQAQNASDGAYSISQLADKLNQINESTTQIDTLSQNTNKLTLQGLNRVDNLMSKSNITMQSTNKVSELVHETKESMEQISAISDTIDAITTQTNLLSLNASIEAARAGESGKGFAIVASEIRQLADQSKVATVRIKEIIDDINQKTTLSVDAMEVTNSNVKEQVSLVNQTQSLFNEIMDAVNTLSAKVSEIKDGTDEITSQKDNIVSEIESISAISEESASATEEVTASTEQISVTMDQITQQANVLQQLSEQLQDRINYFKLKD